LVLKDTVKTTVTGIEMFNKQLQGRSWLAIMQVFSSEVLEEDMTRGQVIAKPGS